MKYFAVVVVAAVELVDPNTKDSGTSRLRYGATEKLHTIKTVVTEKYLERYYHDVNLIYAPHYVVCYHLFTKKT